MTAFLFRLSRDFRFAFRSLLRTPGFSAMVVATMAIGIGANVALFGYLSHFLWPMVKAPESHRLFQVVNRMPGAPFAALSYPDFRDLEAAGDEALGALVEQLAAYRLLGVSVGYAQGTAHTFAHAVTGGYFEIFPCRPHLGRLLTPADDLAGAERVIVLSHFFWQRHFGGAPDAVGRSVRLDGGADYRVVGIVPRGFQGEGLATGVYLPLATAPWIQNLEARERPLVFPWIRLAPGVTRAQLEDRLETVTQGLDEAFPLDRPRQFGTLAASEVGVWEGDEPVVRGAKVLMAAVALLLVLGCANVANLMVARADARERDLAVHAALGAGRWGLCRRLFLESLLLAVAGGALGLFLAERVLALIEHYLLRSLPVSLGDWNQGASLSFDLRWMALFVTAVVLLTALLVGMAPVVRSWRLDLVAGLKADGRGSGGGRSRLRRSLVVVQIALSLVLLTTAALLVRSLWNVRSADFGFHLGDQTLATVYLPRAERFTGSSDDDGVRQAQEVYRQLAADVRTLPGVRAAGFAKRLPLGFTPSLEVSPEGTAERRTLGQNAVGEGFFEALRVPLLQGRLFDSRDREDSPPVVIVSRRAAEQLWPEGGALGRRLRVYEGSEDEVGEVVEVVGIVGFVQQSFPAEPQVPIVYFPHEQQFRARTTLIVDGDTSTAKALHELFRTRYRNVAVVGIESLAEQARRSVVEQRMNADFAAGFGLLGLLLASLGVFSVLSFEVGRRRREIGLRMAVGADGPRIRRLVLGETARLTMLGLALGLATSVGAAGLVESLLYGVDPLDPWSLALVSLVLLVVALSAALLPAARAARLEPLRALREE